MSELESIALRLEQSILARIQSIIAAAREWEQKQSFGMQSIGLKIVEHDAAAMATVFARNIVGCATAFVDPKLLGAVLERPILANRWPWPGRSAPRSDPELDWSALNQLRCRLGDASSTDHQGDTLDELRWPSEAAPKSVAEWARDAGNQAWPGYGDALVEWAQADRMPVWQINFSWNDAGLWLPVYGLALLFLAVQEVERDRQRRIVPFSANREGHSALQVLSAGPRASRWTDVRRDGNRMMLVWKGSGNLPPVQLSLEWNDPGGAALAGILQGLKEDGARDYLILNRMAAEQGRTGEFTWTWTEHRERSVYARRIRQKNSAETNLQTGVSERLKWLARAELRMYRNLPPDDRKRKREEWIRVGDHGIIDIPAGIDSFDGLEAARVRFNSAIYSGAARGAAAGNCFALVSEEALMLNGEALRLAALLACGRWYACEEKGVLVRTARNLWEISTLRGGDPAPKRRPRAAAALECLLDRLGQVNEIGNWEQLDPGAVTPDTRYRITPPSWWVVQVLHGLRELPPATMTLPRTGLDLRTWRERQGLSQRDAAKRLIVGQATLSRAEASGAGPVSAKLLERLRVMLVSE